AILSCVLWVWELDPGPGKGPIPISRTLRLPVYRSGPSSHSWWAMVVLMLVAGSLYLAYVFSYLYLWTVSPEVWAPAGAPAPPQVLFPLASGGLLLASIGAFAAADRALPRPPMRSLRVPVFTIAGALLLTAAVALELVGHWQSGLRPTDSAYGAMVYM